MERLAIIGGGASGLIAAHWLRRRIDVTVFEKRAELGGNVRTVNGNVSSPSVPSDLKLETGVLGFHKKSGPVLHALLEELGTAVRTGQPTASLYRQGHYYPSNFTDLMTPAIMMQLVKQPAYRRNMNALRSDYAASFRRFTRWDGASEEQVEALFGPNETVNDFIQSLLALA
ncbi:MAG: FAD-dependent oxidoreductase, partial [Pseudomonadota bacterium]